MKPTRLLPLAATLAALSTASAVDFIKLNNATALNTAGAWQNNAVPGTGDVLVWDSTGPATSAPRTVGALSAIGSDLSVQGLKVTNPSGTANGANLAIGIQNPLSSSTLTLGSAGINMASATQAIYLETKIALSANQTWSINNANTNANPAGFSNGEDLSFRGMNTTANTTTATIPFDLGGFTVTTSGTGQSTISSGYAIANGTINVGNNLFLLAGGDSRLVTVGSNVNLNVASGATLQLQTNSGGIISAANITLNGGTLRLTSSNATQPLTITGTTTIAATSTLNLGNRVNAVANTAHSGFSLNSNLTGSANLDVTNNATNATNLLVGGNNSGYSGTITLGGTAGRITRLTAANAGSAAATWSVSAGHVLQTAGLSVSLGTLNGAGSVTSSSAGTPVITVGAGSFSGVISNGTGTVALTKIGTGTLTLSGINTYTGATTVSQGSLLGVTAGSLTSAVSVADGATFGANVSSAGTTFTLPSLTLGSTTGSTLEINTGALGNPTTAPVTATSLSVPVVSVLKVTGTNLTAGTFPVLAFTGATGTANLTLLLPPRHNGSLVTNPGDLSVNLSSVEQIRWNGDVNSTWDTSAANWKTTVTDTSTAYIQTATGSDVVNLTDSAAGSGPVTVNLVGTLTPSGVTASNITRAYTLSGSGKLSGSTILTKSGAASLTLANTTANDHTGGTFVNEGSLVLGDGVTAGAGQITGNIVVNSTLVLNRPDDFTFSNTLTGTGTLRKAAANTVTIAGTSQITSRPLDLQAGKLLVTGGGTLSGLLSGAGQLELASGTLLINGTVPNTNTGLTTVSGTGTILQLGNSSGAALGGDVTVTGTARITPTLGTQLAPTATYTLLGSNTDSYLSPAALSAETVANVVINSSVAGAGGGQLVMRNGFTVTGSSTLSRGILGVGSGNTATLNAVTITATNTTDAILRIAGNSAASVLNIGPGGITASGGDIQIKFNTTDQDATLNLGGDFTATGNVIITNGGYTGASLNVINLIGERAFNIGAGTTTTVAPDLAGSGTLTKTGAGTLVLNTSCAATHTGGTTVSAGSLIVNGSIGDVTVDGATAVLGGSTASGTATIGNVTAVAGATVSPGNAGLGRLALNDLALGTGGKVLLEASAPTTRHDGTTGTYDALNVTGNLALDGTFTLAAISGYTPVLGDSFDLWNAATVNATAFNVATDLVLPALTSGLAWDTSAFTTTGVVTVVNSNPFVGWQSSKFTAGELLDTNISGSEADPDGDGIKNALEYAFGTEPKSGNSGAYLPQSNVVAGALTLAYRRPVGGVSGVTYAVEVNSLDLTSGGANWTPASSPADYSQVATPNGDGSETVKITFSGTVSGKKFARISVTF